MSATSRTFNVTDSSTGATQDISSINIVLVTTDGSGAKILYADTDSPTPIQLKVTETPAAINTASQYLIALTDTATSGVFYVNVDRINPDIITNGSGSNVYYNMGFAEAHMFTVNESRTAIRTAIASVVSGSGGSAGVTTPVATVSIVEYGDGRDFVTELTLTDFVVGALAGAAAALGVGNIVAAYPAGQHFELVDSFAALSLKCAGTAVATKLGLGSVIASGAVSVLSGTATFQDRIAGITANTSSTGGTAVSTVACTTAGIGTGIALNVSGSVKNVFLNAAGTWNANNTANLTCSGTIILKWTKMN